MALRREYVEQCIRETWARAHKSAFKDGHWRLWRAYMVEPDPVQNFELGIATDRVCHIVTFERSAGKITGSVGQIVVTVSE